jgi:hypothetical protein
VKRALSALLACALFVLSPGAAQAVLTGQQDDSTGSTQDGGNLKVWRASAKQAAAAQGSACPWVYIKSTGDDLASDRTSDQIDPSTGRWLRLFRDCNGKLYLVLEPTGRELAKDLYDELPALIKPSKVGFQPVDNLGAFVKVDTWYWLETNYTPINRRKGLLGIEARIEARPTTITTDWGDGNTTTCTAPGLDYATAKHPTLLRDPDPAPDGGCSYRYTTHSGKQPGQKFTVRTTVRWEASWTSGGESGTFAPITRETVNQLKVDQIQAILTKP